MVSDAEVSRIFWDGIEDRASLSESDRRRFDPLMSMMYQGFAQQWEYRRRGLDTSTGWDHQERGMRWQAGRRGAVEWWAEYRNLFTSEFRDYVDGTLRGSSATD